MDINNGVVLSANMECDEPPLWTRGATEDVNDASCMLSPLGPDAANMVTGRSMWVSDNALVPSKLDDPGRAWSCGWGGLFLSSSSWSCAK